MSLWTFAINNAVQLKDFSIELAFDYKSSGSWPVDYDHYSKRLAIQPCPSFSIAQLDEGKTACKLANRIIDLGSWRAMLLACSASGSSVVEISIHNCQLSPQHISDLILAFEKIGRLEAFKFDHCTILPQDAVANTRASISLATKKRSSTSPNPDGLAAQFALFAGFFSCACTIDYISLRGDELTDEFIAVILPVLGNNLTLQSINLSNNFITDAGAGRLFQLLKFHHSLRNICLRSNLCEGICLDIFASLIGGIAATAEDEHSIKSISKLIADKNKQSKESNKKRKKLGLLDLEDVHPFNEHRLNKADKSHGSHVLSNRTLGTVDLSCNPIGLHHIRDMLINLHTKAQENHSQAPPVDVHFSFRNICESDADLEFLAALPLPDGVNVALE